MVKRLIFTSILLWYIVQLNAQDNTPENGQSSFTIKGDWFLAHQWFIPNHDNNAFKLKRGYLTVENTFSNTFSARYIQDITIDNEGDDAGNVELRFKYC